MLSFTIIFLILIFILIMFLSMRKSIRENEKKEQMFNQCYYITNYWLKIRNEDKNIEEYLLQNNIKTIGIYGAGELGKRLYEELRNSKVKIKYITDAKMKQSNSQIDYEGIPIVDYTNFNIKDGIDAIIITPVFYMESIERDLKNAGVTKKIISLEKIISDIYNTI